MGPVQVVSDDEATVDLFGESTSGNLHFIFSSSDEEEAAAAAAAPPDGRGARTHRPPLGLTPGLPSCDNVLSLSYADVVAGCNAALGELGVPPGTYPAGRPQRAIFCSRTLNLRSIAVIGYDLDYTLIHYDINAWEGKAYEYGMAQLRALGCPVDGLRFDPELVIRGLIIDAELGNLVKVDRFGFVKRAMHGTRMLSAAEVRAQYGRTLVNLRHESRWVFLNTLFSVSEAVMYMQMVDLLDEGAIPPAVCPQSYGPLYRLVARALFNAHVEGKLKAEIVQAPERYVELDGSTAQALLDQRQAGKTLLLITNSDITYTETMMSYAYNRYLPPGMTWRDLFDMHPKQSNSKQPNLL